MKTRFGLFVAMSFVAVGVHAGSLKIVNVNFPAIFCLFNTNCTSLVNDSTSPVTLTNVAVTGYLQSRTFKGLPGTAEAGQYGYAYRIVLNNLAGSSTNSNVKISSLAMAYGAISSFSYNGQASNQVWVATKGGLGTVGPSSVSFTNSGFGNFIMVGFNFNPPIFLAGGTNQGASSYFFGVISSRAPTNATAVISGTVQLSPGKSVPFNLHLPVRTP
jgi:hypothetical protein